MRACVACVRAFERKRGKRGNRSRSVFLSAAGFGEKGRGGICERAGGGAERPAGRKDFNYQKEKNKRGEKWWKPKICAFCISRFRGLSEEASRFCISKPRATEAIWFLILCTNTNEEKKIYIYICVYITIDE